jgi:uncharacterized protein YprB with RNaseH-like and TPR domain
MAEVFDEYTHEEVLLCLEMLGSDRVENYHEQFIKRLYERYQNASLIDSLVEHNQKFFFKFAKCWPHFLKNNSLLERLIKLGG